MKVPSSTIESLARLIKRALAANQVQHTPTPSDGLLWNVWHWVFSEIAYDDSHPRFVGRKRLFPHNPAFELYPHDTNDETMTTALRKAFALAGTIQD